MKDQETTSIRKRQVKPDLKVEQRFWEVNEDVKLIELDVT